MPDPRTRRKWYPDMHWVQLYSEILAKRIPFMVTPEVLKKIGLPQLCIPFRCLL